MNAAQVLRKARALLVERGWKQEGYGLPEGPYCSFGAVNMAVSGHPWRATPTGSGAAAKRFLYRAVDCESIFFWNDRPKRTKRQVIAAFSKAIKLAERGRK